MSVTFYIATPDMRRAHNCDCTDRFILLWDDAEASGSDYPDTLTCEVCGVELNLANANAIDLLNWVGQVADGGPDGLVGECSARELAAICRRRLWNETRNHDPMVPAAQRVPADAHPIARVLTFDRRPGYLRSQVERLLVLCEKAGEDLIAWS